MLLDASAGRGSCVYCVALPVRLCSLQSIRVESQAAASSKLRAILANLPGGCVAWWKLVPDSERYLLLGSGLGTASGFLLFGPIKIQSEAGMWFCPCTFSVIETWPWVCFTLGNPFFSTFFGPGSQPLGKIHKSKDVVHLWRKMGRLTLPPQAFPKDSFFKGCMVSYVECRIHLHAFSQRKVELDFFFVCLFLNKSTFSRCRCRLKGFGGGLPRSTCDLGIALPKLGHSEIRTF